MARTPDNERKVGELVAQYNEGRRQHATIEYATAALADAPDRLADLAVRSGADGVVAVFVSAESAGA